MSVACIHNKNVTYCTSTICWRKDIFKTEASKMCKSNDSLKKKDIYVKENLIAA